MEDQYKRQPNGQFGKGSCGGPGNPTGHITRKTIDAAFNRLGKLTMAELKAFVADQSNPVTDMMIASTMLKCIVDGDATRFNALLDRAIGKVKDMQDLNITSDISKKIDEIPAEKIKTILRKAS